MRRSIMVTGLLLVLAAPTRVVAQDDGLGMPPLSPDREAAAPADPVFAQDCLRFLAGLRARSMEPRLLATAVSLSTAWGRVLRADVILRDGKGPDMTVRIVCWTSKDGHPQTEIAVDPRIPLLVHRALGRDQARLLQQP